MIWLVILAGAFVIWRQIAALRWAQQAPEPVPTVEPRGTKKVSTKKKPAK